jgi:hypothetical protein
MPLGLAGLATHIDLASKDKVTNSSARLSSVSLFEQGLVQVLQAAVTGLEPKHPYVLALAAERGGGGQIEPLASFTTNPAGAAIVNAIGPLRQVASGNSSAPRRFLVIAPGTVAQHGDVVQVQID